MRPRPDVLVSLKWQSRCARHVDRRFLGGIDPRRDDIAGLALAPLAEHQPGDSVRLGVRHVFVARNDAEVRRSTLQGWRHSRPLVGRHYPRGLLAEFPRGDLRPFRVLDAGDASLLGDFNPPLAGIECEIEAAVVGISGPETQPSQDASRFLFGGPGMQAALPDRDTDFFSGAPFARADESDDARFYARARLVDHLDATTRAELTRLYARHLQPGDRVLDLMASWNSHLPKGLDLEVTGLGMNAAELDHNPRLAARMVHDLNRSPQLPFDDAAFDAALCALSIEYLIRPVEVVREVGRVLRPGTPFLIAFSDRWFPPKAIRLWSELHPFERMALIADYLRLSGMFGAIETESLAGLPPPSAAHHRPFSDPLFVVIGRRSG